MKVNIFVYLIAIMFFTVGCSSNRQPEGSLPYIDVRKNYPEKEIILTDIADITYVHMSVENEDYLYKGTISYISENKIVIIDRSSGNILFFSKNGNPISRFNRLGTGPEEYPTKWVGGLLYNESEDDLFITSSGKILVYSSIGEYKRTLILPQGVSPDKIIDFDDLSFLLYDAKNVYTKMKLQSDIDRSLIHFKDSSYFRIDKKDGKVLDYIAISNNQIDLSFTLRNGALRLIPTFNRLEGCAEGAILFNHETDTVFFYGKDYSLSPIFCKTPLVRELDPVVILDNFIDIGMYQYMEITTLSEDNGTNKYIRDKKTGEIFKQKVIISDYKEKYISISAQHTLFNGKETLSHYELDLYELKEAYKENKLSGQLKELVSTLNEDEDNNVFMIVHFKK